MSRAPVSFKEFSYRRRKSYGFSGSSLDIHLSKERQHDAHGWLGSFKRRAEKANKPVCEIEFDEDNRGVRSIRYINEGENIVVGYRSGGLEVSDATTGELNCVLRKGEKFGHSITCIRSIPESQKLFCSTLQGVVLECFTEYSRCRTHIQETENEIYSIDLSSDRIYLASGGRDAILRLYDATFGKLIHRFGKSETGRKDKVHKSRICCVKAHSHQSNTFLSGGWDNTLRIWDVRDRSGSVGEIAGPHICGDAIDVRDNKILTGSWTAVDSLQIWDIRTTQLIETITPNNCPTGSEFLYSAQFFNGDPLGEIVLTGGSGNGLFEVINTKEKMSLNSFRTTKAVLAIDSTDNHAVFGGMQPIIRIVAV